MKQQRLPVEPLVEAAVRRYKPKPTDRMAGITDHGKASAVTGVDRRTFCRWARTGLTVFQADDVAHRMGLMPHEIWSDWYSGL